MRPPHLERELALEFVALGAMIADKSLRESIDPADFSPRLAGLAEHICSGVWSSFDDGTLRYLTGTDRKSGEKLAEAIFARFASDGAIRRQEKVCRFTAISSRMLRAVKNKSESTAVK